MIKLISWNVNGFRAVLNKGFIDFFENIKPDIIGLQEIKLQEGQVDFSPEGYYTYWNYAEKKGYSGTAVFTKHKPLNVFYGINIEEHDKEGRVITLEYDKFFFVTVYTPNSKPKLERLEYRMKWEDDFLNYINTLNRQKPVILCGDLNVAHTEIDLKYPKNNARSNGFTIEERNKFTQLLNAGYIDSYRYQHPGKKDAYSWWSYMGKARQNNSGWRIDYFVISDILKEKIVNTDILSDVMGSDHCPVSITINDIL